MNAPLTPHQDRLVALRRAIFGVGIGGILLAALLSFVLSRSLSRPLLEMNSAARAMAAGDFSRKVEVRTGDEIGLLANSLNTLSGQLQEKIFTLERLDETRKDFVAGISHELRTPLAIMQGYAEALQDNIAETEEERQEQINSIMEEIQRLKRLVAELLDLRGIETGQQRFELSQVEILPVIEKSIEKMKTLAQEKGVILESSFAEQLPLVKSNPDRLEQVMINLLDNAITYTPGGGKVEVKVSSSSGHVLVQVVDGGPGIPVDEQELVWEKFYKVDKSRTRSAGGTGLGLSILKRLVEHMGGEIRVSNAGGSGAVFSFTLIPG